MCCSCGGPEFNPVLTSSGWKLFVTADPVLLRHTSSCEHTIYRSIHTYKLKFLKLELTKFKMILRDGLDNLTNWLKKTSEHWLKRKDILFKDVWNTYLNIYVHKTIYNELGMIEYACIPRYMKIWCRQTSFTMNITSHIKIVLYNENTTQNFKSCKYLF